MDLYIGTLKKLGTVKTLDFSKLTSFQLFILNWVGIEVVFKSSQLSHPLAALLFINAVKLKIIERSFQSLVFKTVKLPRIATRARLVVCPDSLNAHTAKSVSTAGGLVGLSKDQQTHRTLTLNSFWRLLHEFTVKSTLLVRHERLRFQIT